MKDWPLGDGRYLPMDAAEFQRLVEAANARRSPARTAPPAVVAAARYEAKWLGERLVGKAALEVILAGPAPAVLPLEPCNLAVGKASWRAADTREAKPPEPVALAQTATASCKRWSIVRAGWASSGRWPCAAIWTAA